MSARMHVAQQTASGCVPACVAMLLRHHGVDPTADEPSVRANISSMGASGTIDLRGTWSSGLLGSCRLDDDDPSLFVIELATCIEKYGPVILEVSCGLSHNFAFDCTLPPSSQLGSILPYASRVASYHLLGAHAVVVTAVDTHLHPATATLHDPWYGASHQPLHISLDTIFAGWMGAGAYRLRTT